MAQDTPANNLRHLEVFPKSAIESIWVKKPDTSEYYRNVISFNLVKVYPVERSVTATELCIADLLKEEGYKIDENDLAGITEFMLANPQLIQELKNAPEIIKSYFQNSDLKLKLYTDTEEEYCNLNILILNNYSVEEAFAKEEELFKKHFKIVYLKHKGKLNIREVSAN
jgi:hypothetical protein